MGDSVSFLIALGLSVVATAVAAAIGRRLNIVDRPEGGLKIHDVAIPLTGGVAVFAAAWGAVVGSLQPNVVAATSLALAIGLVDDIRPLAPWLRTIGLSVAGAFLATTVFTFTLPGVLGAVCVVALVLACTQAVNLIDGQDGLAAGLGCVSALGLAWLAHQLGSGGEAAALALAGGLAGFLFHNRPPARVFLGNSGAYALGTALAGLAVPVVAETRARGVLVAGACLGVFAFELCFTVGRRVLGRASLSIGDRCHSYDLMATVTGSRTRSTLVFVAAGCVAFGLAALVAGLSVMAGAVIVTSVSSLATLVGIVLWRSTIGKEDEPSGRTRSQAL